MKDIKQIAWNEGERAGQSNAREAMRCETCAHFIALPSGLYCKGPPALNVEYTSDMNFGCIHHQAKG